MIIKHARRKFLECLIKAGLIFYLAKSNGYSEHI